MQDNRIRADIYLRISEDPKLTGLGVERQLEDCRELCEKRGWIVEVVHTDNDISAYSGKPRPGYKALLGRIKNGEVDRVIAWHTDRLHRRLRELVEYCDVVTAAGVTTHTVKAGDIDLSTPNGIMMAQIKGAVDEAYVSEARLKNLRARRQIAEAGKRHCARRPYGWEPGGQEIRPDEAAVVREICKRIIAGETPTGIAYSLNEREIPTVEGKRWTGIGVRKCAARASNAAIREHQGKLYYNGTWEPIISHDEYAQVQAALNVRATMKYKRGVGRKYLLTGFVYCGQCGNKLSATVGSSGRKPAYRCHKSLSNDNLERGCGKVSRCIEPLELLVQKAVLARLNSPAVLDAIATRKSSDSAVSDLLLQRDNQSARVDQLVTDYATGVLSADQFRQAKQIAEQKLGELNQELSRLTMHTELAGVDLSVDLETAWAANSLSWRRNLVELLVERVEVLPYPEGYPRKFWEGFKFAPELVRVRWRI